jgi:predicted PurR-regulated permease PerM
MVGSKVEMHPLLVFFAIIGGLKLFGILGIIYGPLVVTAFLTLAEIYRANYQHAVEDSRI